MFYRLCRRRRGEDEYHEKLNNSDPLLKIRTTSSIDKLLIKLNNAQELILNELISKTSINYTLNDIVKNISHNSNEYFCNLNHKLFGDDFFVKFAYNIFDQKWNPIKNNWKILFNLKAYFISIKWFLTKKTLIKKSEEYVNLKEEVEFTITTDNTTYISKRVRVYYLVLKKICELCNVRYIKVAIPQPFESTSTIRNNVGVVFITFYDNITIEQFNVLWDCNKYTALLTNYISRYNFFIDNGSIRKNCDVILSALSCETGNLYDDVIIYFEPGSNPIETVYISSFTSIKGNKLKVFINYCIERSLLQV